jgi:hypothetical protein
MQGGKKVNTIQIDFFFDASMLRTSMLRGIGKEALAFAFGDQPDERRTPFGTAVS